MVTLRLLLNLQLWHVHIDSLMTLYVYVLILQVSIVAFLTVDPTFDLDDFECTPISCCHLLLVTRNTTCVPWFSSCTLQEVFSFLVGEILDVGGTVCEELVYAEKGRSPQMQD